MEIYNSEEEQLAALKRWWAANGSSAISGVVVGVLVIGGWNLWKSYNQGQGQLASAMYQQLIKANSEDKLESVNKISEQLAEKYGSTSYAAYAALVQAKIKVEQGDVATARQLLEHVAASAEPELQNVAKLRLVRLLLAKGEYEQGLQLIAEMDQTKVQGFTAGFEELKGDLYVALDRIDEARTAYQNALRAGQSSPLLQLKLDDLTAPEFIENQG